MGIVAVVHNDVIAEGNDTGMMSVLVNVLARSEELGHDREGEARKTMSYCS